MAQLIRVQDATQLERFYQAEPILSLQQVQQQKADGHWLLLNSANEVVARCSLWWQQTPSYESHRPGLIGHFAARDLVAASELLTAACAELKAHGCTMAMGPMDGNTWQRYRLMTERGEAPTFFLEPDNPDDWAQYFAYNGFTSVAQYFSTLTTDLRARNPRMDSVAAQMTALGVTIRAAQPERLTEDLARIYAVASVAFQSNFLFTPIGQAEFIAQYELLQPFIQPELILLAEHEQQPVGFLFAVPDLMQAQRGQVVDTFIVKTVAVLPDEKYRGLGSLLVARSHEIGAALGFQRAIHALMHEVNKSRGISNHYSQPLRRYALFGKAV